MQRRRQNSRNPCIFNQVINDWGCLCSPILLQVLIFVHCNIHDPLSVNTVYQPHALNYACAYFNVHVERVDLHGRVADVCSGIGEGGEGEMGRFACRWSSLWYGWLQRQVDGADITREYQVLLAPPLLYPLRADKLDRVVFRVGVLAALRSRATKGITCLFTH